MAWGSFSMELSERSRNCSLYLSFDTDLGTLVSWLHEKSKWASAYRPTPDHPRHCEHTRHTTHDTTRNTRRVCVQGFVDEFGVAEEEEAAGALVDDVLVQARADRLHTQRSAVAVVDRKERKRQIAALVNVFAALFLFPSILTTLAALLLFLLLQLPGCGWGRRRDREISKLTNEIKIFTHYLLFITLILEMNNESRANRKRWGANEQSGGYLELRCWDTGGGG